MKIRLVTVVWGRDFVDTFVRVGLRSLLANGNARELARAHEVIYTIYTTSDDAQRLEAAPAFMQLRKAVDVRFSLFGLGEIDGSDPGSHGVFWNYGIKLAQRNGEILFFIIPDVLYARGTLLRWAQAFERGKRAVFTLGPLVVLETALPELEMRFPNSCEPYDLTSDQILYLLYRHFHPLHTIMRSDSMRRHAHPEFDLRVIPGQGVIIRDLMCPPFCLDPSFYSQLRNFTPQDHLDTIALEPCSAVSFEPLLKSVRHWYRPWPLNENRLSNLGGWWDWFATKSGERVSECPFDLCPAADAFARSQRVRASGAGRFYRSQVMLSGKIFRLFVELRGRGFFGAARLLAFANYRGRIRRRIGLRRGATLLVPTNAAIEAGMERVRGLLAPGRERDFLNLFFDHVVLTNEERRLSRRQRSIASRKQPPVSRADEMVTARGLRAEPLLAGARSAGEPFSVGPFTIYPIDRVLWRKDVYAEAKSGEAVGTQHPVIGSHNPNHSPNRTSLKLAPTSFRYTLKDHLRRQSNFLRGVARSMVPSMNTSRRLVLAVERVPLIGRLTYLSVCTLDRIQHDGVSVTLRKIAARSPLIRRLVTHARSTAMVSLGRRAVHAARRDGLPLAMRKAARRAWLTVERKWVKPPIDVGSEDLEVLNQIRGVRALQAAEQALAEFYQELDVRDVQSAPLAFVQQKLNEFATLNAMPVSQIVAERLVELTRRHPTWAEVWLELGFLRQDEGRAEDALECFERAMQGRLNNTSNTRANPIAVAAASRGRLLAAAASNTEALNSFSFSLRHEPNQYMVAVECADALRRSGQLDAALAYYTQGMYYQAQQWSLPGFPRNAKDMTFACLAQRL
jgi:hypothetical protein